MDYPYSQGRGIPLPPLPTLDEEPVLNPSVLLPLPRPPPQPLYDLPSPRQQLVSLLQPQLDHHLLPNNSSKIPDAILRHLHLYHLCLPDIQINEDLLIVHCLECCVLRCRSGESAVPVLSSHISPETLEQLPGVVLVFLADRSDKGAREDEGEHGESAGVPAEEVLIYV